MSTAGKLTILHVVTAPRAEGTPRLVLDWLHTPTPHRQAVVFLSRANTELLPDFYETGSEIHFIEAAPKGLRKIRHIRREIADVCNKVKPDIVISWTTGMSQWIHLGAHKAGVRKLLTHAGNPPYGGFVQKYIYTYMSFWIGTLLGAKCIVPSEYIMNKFRSIPLLQRSDFYKVFNCFDVAKFVTADGPSSTENAIMVATLESHKDHPTLLRAWSLLKPGEVPGKLFIAGHGTRAEELKKIAAGLNLQNVEFIGSRSDVPQLLRKCKVFVLSTTTAEGFGTVLIEALFAGLNIVATDVPACREVLQNGKYGILVAPSNADALARAIITAFNSNDTSAEIQERVEYAKQFSPVAMMKGYLRVAGINTDHER